MVWNGRCGGKRLVRRDGILESGMLLRSIVSRSEWRRIPVSGPLGRSVGVVTGGWGIVWASEE